MSEDVRSCYTCKHFHTSPGMPPCKDCFGVQGHPHYEEGGGKAGNER